MPPLTKVLNAFSGADFFPQEDKKLTYLYLHESVFILGKKKKTFPKVTYRLSGAYFQLSLASRQMLLLETLKVKQSLLDPVPAALKLPVAVSCYWVQHTEATLKLHHLQALLLGMLLGPLRAMVSSPGRLPACSRSMSS